MGQYYQIKDLKENSKLSELRAKIKDLTGLDNKEQHIINLGKELEENDGEKTLDDLEIGNGSVIHCITKLPGGSH